jgi:hypothetical protein
VKLARLLLPFGLLLGCRDASRVTDAAPSQPSAETGNLQSLAPIEHREAGKWVQKEGAIEWRAIVIPPRTTHADLLRLARSLHAQSPRVFFDLYDDDAELPKLVAAEGNDDALSKAWREAHAVGTLTAEVREADGSATVRHFQLVEWKTLETTGIPD